MLKQIKNINLTTDQKKVFGIAAISLAAAFGLAAVKKGFNLRGGSQIIYIHDRIHPQIMTAAQIMSRNKPLRLISYWNHAIPFRLTSY